MDYVPNKETFKAIPSKQNANISPEKVSNQCFII